MGCNPERPALLILALAQVGMPFKTMVAECTEMHLRLRLAVTPGLCLIVTSQCTQPNHFKSVYRIFQQVQWLFF